MLDTLLAGLFDYAGMFPPASLSFDDALRRSATFPDTLRRPGILGADMVVALDDATRLTPAALRRAGFKRPCAVCLVGVPPDRTQEAIETTLRLRGDGMRVLAIEAAHAHPMSFDVEGWEKAAQAAASLGARLYIEPRWDDAGWRRSGARFWPWVAAIEGTGAKFRCAGPTAVEDVDTLADIVLAATAHKVPLKATQGLHHPLPGPSTHGFLNLVAGLRLAQNGLPHERLRELLACRDIQAFTFDGLGWDGQRVLGQHLADAASRLPFAIGSCSLDEPDQDLAALFG